ncbi:unnamed protein product, partial [Didymodactylos carnosus]
MGILIGESALKKSEYVALIRKAFDFLETIFHDQFVEYDEQQQPTHYSTCIESTTDAKIIATLQHSSKFLSSDEDGPLTSMAFFEPGTLIAAAKQSTFLTAYNGIYDMKKDTMTYSKRVQNKSLSVLVPSTGSKFSTILEYFDNGNTTSGLFERFLYYVITPTSISNAIRYGHEQQLNTKLPALECVFITRYLMGNRVYMFDDKEYEFINPILIDLLTNETPPEISTKPPSTKRNKALQRRSADHLVRIITAFQALFDVCDILSKISDFNFHKVPPSLIADIEKNINQTMYDTKLTTIINVSSTDQQYIVSSIQQQPKHGQYLPISMKAISTGLKFYDKLLYPISAMLFSYDMDIEQQTRQDNENEKKLLLAKFKVFTVTSLTGKATNANAIFHHPKPGCSSVQTLIANLAQKGFLKEGKFVRVSNKRVLTSWCKVIPDPRNDDQLKQIVQTLKQDYGLSLADYLDNYATWPDSADMSWTLLGDVLRIIQEQQRFLEYHKDEQKRKPCERKSNLMVNHTQLIGALNNIPNKNVGDRNKNEIQLNGAGPSGQSHSCSRNKATSPVHVTNITRTRVKDQQRTILEPQNTQSSITIENIYPEISERHASHNQTSELNLITNNRQSYLCHDMNLLFDELIFDNNFWLMDEKHSSLPVMFSTNLQRGCDATILAEDTDEA